MIELTNVKKAFNVGTPSECSALNGITLTISDKMATVLVGPSGSGKTTLLTIIGCMARPSSGRVTLNGREITSLPERFLTEIRRKTFGFIFQQPNLIKGITALENVMLPAYPTGTEHAALREEAMRLLHGLHLAEKAVSKVEWLSGGEAQRVSIARALINNPSAIIADEPTAHLDTSLSRRFLEIVERFKAEGKTILMTSHDPLVYQSRVVDRVVRLRDGKLEEAAG
ncbi:ABC transporter ATP-binding protein [Candidatus Methylomirabilis lanthanidiphila]|uniref:ABC transporter ATP-binding protein n=1 Tax=Candidatus Methylomirabilis lanthanidiphila TaxID=2211376 RepID=A0A564ZH09_9BACT|nr:ABC transporter ATP-binding protein [Candidatus Methylomirabilis lanthanidiphila]VUZ84609.1 ABC transporter ATP-binding protein [Candidatus Methylomirabilis lanthanidiphila]